MYDRTIGNGFQGNNSSLPIVMKIHENFNIQTADGVEFAARVFLLDLPGVGATENNGTAFVFNNFAAVLERVRPFTSSILFIFREGALNYHINGLFTDVFGMIRANNIPNIVACSVSEFVKTNRNVDQAMIYLQNLYLLRSRVVPFSPTAPMHYCPIGYRNYNINDLLVAIDRFITTHARNINNYAVDKRNRSERAFIANRILAFREVVYGGSTVFLALSTIPALGYAALLSAETAVAVTVFWPLVLAGVIAGSVQFGAGIWRMNQNVAAPN